MIRAALLAAALLFAGSSASRAADCALALALALDISSSVNSREYYLQKDGVVAALRHPDVREALLTAPGSVRIAVYEWSSARQQALVADWRVMDDPADIDALAMEVDRHERGFAQPSTALGNALAFGARLFERLPAPCLRQVIDVSGDGVSNGGASPAEVRARGLLAGVTVNGLVIKGARPDPEVYYRDEVIGGPGAFMIVARNGFIDYPDLILGKLIREIKPPLFIGSAGGAAQSAPVAR